MGIFQNFSLTEWVKRCERLETLTKNVVRLLCEWTQKLRCEMQTKQGTKHWLASRFFLFFLLVNLIWCENFHEKTTSCDYQKKSACYFSFTLQMRDFFSNSDIFTKSILIRMRSQIHLQNKNKIRKGKNAAIITLLNLLQMKTFNSFQEFFSFCINITTIDAYCIQYFFFWASVNC